MPLLLAHRRGRPDSGPLRRLRHLASRRHRRGLARRLIRQGLARRRVEDLAHRKVEVLDHRKVEVLDRRKVEVLDRRKVEVLGRRRVEVLGRRQVARLGLARPHHRQRLVRLRALLEGLARHLQRLDLDRRKVEVLARRLLHLDSDRRQVEVLARRRVEVLARRQIRHQRLLDLVHRHHLQHLEHHRRHLDMARHLSLKVLIHQHRVVVDLVRLLRLRWLRMVGTVRLLLPMADTPNRRVGVKVQVHRRRWAELVHLREVQRQVRTDDVLLLVFS